MKWFQTFLPKRYKAARATIIDSNGAKSKQIDIVLYDAQYSYLAMEQNGILYLPVESVYAVFEVKQEINSDHLKYAGERAESVRRLERTSVSFPTANGEGCNKPKWILAGILARRIEWSDPFGKSFQENLSKLRHKQIVDIGCALDSDPSNSGSFLLCHERQGNAVDETQKDSDKPEKWVLKTSNAEESLVSFFLQLVLQLQKIGTVPAIDLEKYMNVLSIQTTEWNIQGP